jgi:hypothetical protein
MVAMCKFNFTNFSLCLWISFGSSFLPVIYKPFADQYIAQLQEVTGERICLFAIQP